MLIRRFGEEKGLDFLIFTTTIAWWSLSESVVKISIAAVNIHTMPFLLQTAIDEIQAKKVMSFA